MLRLYHPKNPGHHLYHLSPHHSPIHRHSPQPFAVPSKSSSQGAAAPALMPDCARACGSSGGCPAKECPEWAINPAETWPAALPWSGDGLEGLEMDVVGLTGPGHHFYLKDLRQFAGP